MLAKQCQVRFIFDFFQCILPVNSFLTSVNYLFYAVAVFIFYFLLMQLQFPTLSELFSYAATFSPELIVHEYSVEGWCLMMRRIRGRNLDTGAAVLTVVGLVAEILGGGIVPEAQSQRAVLLPLRLPALLEENVEGKSFE